MKLTISTCIATLLIATAAVAAPLKLKPASPQPTGLKEGLAVKYAYPGDVKSLAQATKYLKQAEAGKPLTGLDYRDTREGEKTLTSKRPFHVGAGISGYVKFDEAGTYTIDFLSNDGLQVAIGGKEIVFFDGRHPCEESAPAEVSVPSAGWYELEATYFQRTGSACLHMRAGQGAPDWMPNSAFGY
jgi:hypothetical protein